MKVDSYESTSQVYGAPTSLRRLASLTTLVETIQKQEGIGKTCYKIYYILFIIRKSSSRERKFEKMFTSNECRENKLSKEARGRKASKFVLCLHFGTMWF